MKKISFVKKLGANLMGITISPTFNDLEVGDTIYCGDNGGLWGDCVVTEKNDKDKDYVQITFGPHGYHTNNYISKCFELPKNETIAFSQKTWKRKSYLTVISTRRSNTALMANSFFISEEVVQNPNKIKTT